MLKAERIHGAFLADLHMHTVVSDGLSRRRDLVSVAAHKGVRIIAITDHDTVQGMEAAQVENGVLVIPGIEISTSAGHMLLYPCLDGSDNLDAFREEYQSRKGPRRLHPHEVVDLAVKHNGVTIIAHPDSAISQGMRIKNIEALVASLDFETKKRVGIEDGGSWLTHLEWGRAHTERKIQTLNQGEHGWGLASVASSDAHFARDVGNMATALEMAEYTSQGFAQAFMERRLAPYDMGRGGNREIPGIVLRALRIEVNNMTTRNGRSIYDQIKKKVLGAAVEYE